jgi:hypothetical protein
VTPLLEQRFEAAGVPLIPLEHGARMFVGEMRRTGTNQAELQQVELVLGGEPQARPLLATGPGSDPGPGLTMELRVDRTSHPYLAGHAINGTPVVPMVLVLEWFSRAARSFRPGMRLISIRDIQVLKGIRLERFDTGGDRLVIVVRPEPDAGLLGLELNAADGTPRYRARLELARSAASTPSAAPDLPLERWNGTPVYGGALFHQGPFQVIQAMEGISDLGAAGILKGIVQAGWADEPWQLDVAALDGGLQLAVLLTERLLGQANLPTSIAEVHTWSDRPGSGPIRCVATRRHLSSTGATTDIVLVDHEGQGITSLNGVQTHLLSGPSRAVAQG